MLAALIMAGGKGTRFWPASTDEKPKQFLSLTTENTMIQETVRRLLPLIDVEHIFVCTGAKYKHLCLEQLPSLPESNIIVEPIGRNTAPCILLSTLYIKQIFNDANIIVLPSDHQINDEPEFLSVLSDANEFIDEEKEAILTIGLTPNRPETGYGYINFNETKSKVNDHEIKAVKRFVEKPNAEVAHFYLNDGHYLWNAGMFMFNADFMMRQYELYAKETFDILTSLPSIAAANYMTELEKKYAACESISVDFAIMEKSDALYVIPADFGWDDIGAWEALSRYLTQDEFGNITKGEIKIKNSKNNTVFTTTKPVILVDAEDLCIIETENRIVVGKRSSLNKVHTLRNQS